MREQNSSMMSYGDMVNQRRSPLPEVDPTARMIPALWREELVGGEKDGRLWSI